MPDFELSQLESFEAFKYVCGENLVTLTTCLNAKAISFAAGHEVLSDANDFTVSALLLDDSVSGITYSGKEIPLKKGMIIGEGFFNGPDGPIFEKYISHSTGQIYLMQYAVVKEPCWFSCFFHAAFCDNTAKIDKEQAKICTESI